ncbi:MAG: tRNA guanosine(34) transglycosylase Tgt [Phycisphaerae bacterium]
MPRAPVWYEPIATDGRARLGRVHTPHGPMETPAFMPVGTQGTVKGLTPRMLRDVGSQCILGNTYHLMLRPGERTVAALGDLHGFMAWDGPILTDSGGFQVFSLADISRIDDAGVDFRSHLDGATVRLDAARSMQVQNALGADIIMAFDHCPPGDAPMSLQHEAMDRTLRWAKECVKAHERPGEQGLFGIVQGGTDLAMRARCANELAELDLPGYALGGLAVGEGFENMRRVLEATTPLLPSDKPRYLMGVGYPRDIVEAVANGVDMFDCVLPTRSGRSGAAFTRGGILKMRNACHREDAGPIEADSPEEVRRFTRGALRHFLLAGEMLGPVLISLHNVGFYQRLMSDIRSAIREGRFDAFRREDPRCAIGPSDATGGLRPTGAVAFKPRTGQKPAAADVPAGPGGEPPEPYDRDDELIEENP